MPFCPKCGTQVQEGVAICPNCGTSILSSPPPAPQPYSSQPPSQKLRPTGVTIISVLVALGGIFSLLAGVGSLAAGSLSRAALPYPALAELISIVGGVLLILGLLYLGLAYGFWTGKGWAWIIGVVLMVIGIIIGIAVLFLISLTAIVSVLIDLLILYYLTRPHVKAFFGKGQAIL